MVLGDPMSRRWQRACTMLLLVGLLMAGAALRLTGINWDQFQHIHPDERFIVWVADSISFPADFSTALDPLRSTIDPFRWPPDHGDESGKPRSYAYGHFPLYLLVFAAHAAQAIGKWLGETTLAFPALLQPLNTIGQHLAEYNYLALVGRALSALCDLGVLALVYALGRRVYGVSAGLLAAGAYAFAVLPIQLSHFYAVDMVLTFCVVATVALAARRAEGGGWPAWLVAGAFAGLAVGSKFSAILVVLPLFAAAWCRVADRRPRALVGQLAATGGAAALVFVVTNPFALIEFPAYLSNILAQNAMVSGIMDAPYTRQYIGTLPYWYFVQQLSQWGTGWPLGFAAWAGLVWALIRFGSHRAGRAETILLAWALPYFALTGAFHAKFLRYMAPLLPFLVIFGSGAAIALLRWLCARWQRRGAVAWGVGVLLVATTTVLWAIAFSGVYRQEHPWIQASRWIFSHIPEGSKLLTEHWDDALPLLMDEIPGRPAPRAYERVELPLYDPDTPDKLEGLAKELSSADYLVIASNRLSAPLSRLRQRYPMTSHYYGMLSQGELGYTPVAEFHAYPQLLGIAIPDQNADESFTVYDHPRAVIYQNTGRLSAELLRARLGRYLPLAVDPASGIVRAGSAGSGRPPGHAAYLPPEQPSAPDAPLTLGQPVDPQRAFGSTLPVVADFRWNRLAGETPVVAVICWWLVLSVLGWAVWPLLFGLLGGLRDHGFALGRTAAWLLVGWIHWMAVSLGLWENRLAPLAGVCGVLVLAGISLGWTQRDEIVAFWVARRRLLLGEEALFGLAFLAFVGIRILNPDLWQPWNGGEKFMESAFLNAILHSAHFPPYDPYFAGGTLNYYYHGLYLVSLPIKLTGIAPEVATNLAVPSLFALTALALFSVGYSLHHPSSAPFRPRASGLLAVTLALLMGNLDALDQFIAQLRQIVARMSIPAFDYWASSRVIPQTINEFPFWTFLFADLHPHLIAMPFGMLVVGLAVNWVVAAGNRKSEAGSRDQWATSSAPIAPVMRRPVIWTGAFCAQRGLLTHLLMVLALGALGAINTWDLPTYFLLVAGAMTAVGWRRGRVAGLLGAGTVAAGIGVASVAAYWPFYAHYESQVGGGSGAFLVRYLGLIHSASPFVPWLTVWGIFVFLSVSALALLWARQTSPSRFDAPTPAEQAVEQSDADMRVEDPAGADAAAVIEIPAGDGELFHSEPVLESQVEPASRLRAGLIAVLSLAGIVLALAVMDRPTAAIMVIPTILALPLIFRRSMTAEQNFVALLLALGTAVVAGTELVYLRDFLQGGDWYRMNTLFKFSVPAWLFLGLACGVMLPRLWDGLTCVPPWARQLWRAAAACLILSGLLFLPLGTQARVKDRFPNARPPIGTLNGMDYMTVGVLDWPSEQHKIDLAYDYLAIQWLLDHVEGTPIIAEAPAGGYAVDGQSVTADYYRAAGLRVASFTGLPTFVGQHQYEQRPAEQVSQRFDLGTEFFTTTDIARARALARGLRVGYVYVGQLERILFAPDSLQKFDVMVELGDLEIVYRNLRTTIYHVKSTEW